MKMVIAGIILLSAMAGTNCFAQQPSDSMCREIYRLINLKRSIYRERPLILNDTISVLAQKHSERMASGKIPTGHEGFDARVTKMKDLFVGFIGKCAENVTEGIDAEEAVDLWWKSEGHKANMLGDYNQTGIGAVKGKDGVWYCTQIFIER